MLANGVAHARAGDLELRFGASPPARVAPESPAEAVPVSGDAGADTDVEAAQDKPDDDEERATLETLLFSSAGGSAVDPILRAIRASRSRPA